MNEELEQLLANLHLKTVAARFDEYLAAADKDGTPFPVLMVQLLRAEWQARQESALAARIQRAKMPESWSLESFPFKIQTGVNQRQIRSFATLDFIPKAENIVFVVLITWSAHAATDRGLVEKCFVIQQSPCDARVHVGQGDRRHLSSSSSDQCAQPVGSWTFTAPWQPNIPFTIGRPRPSYGSR